MGPTVPLHPSPGPAGNSGGKS